MTDFFTKWVIARAIHYETPVSVAEEFIDVIYVHGPPQIKVAS
jgi:hypothetical protein